MNWIYFGNCKGKWVNNEWRWLKTALSSSLVFMLDAAADYPFVNQTTLIEYYLINLSYLTSILTNGNSKLKAGD